MRRKTTLLHYPQTHHPRHEHATNGVYTNPIASTVTAAAGCTNPQRNDLIHSSTSFLIPFLSVPDARLSTCCRHALGACQQGSRRIIPSFNHGRARGSATHFLVDSSSRTLYHSRTSTFGNRVRNQDCGNVLATITRHKVYEKLLGYC